MNQGKLVFSQIMDHVPMTTFRRCVAKHSGDHKIKDFSCFDQFLAMSFAQLTYQDEADLHAFNAYRHQLNAIQYAEMAVMDVQGEDETEEE